MIRTFRPGSAYSTAFRHVSSEPVISPAAGEDSHFDDAILRGDLVVIAAGTLKGGGRGPVLPDERQDVQALPGRAAPCHLARD